jgi:hypothetical protein
MARTSHTTPPTPSIVEAIEATRPSRRPVPPEFSPGRLDETLASAKLPAPESEKSKTKEPSELVKSWRTTVPPISSSTRSPGGTCVPFSRITAPRMWTGDGSIWGRVRVEPFEVVWAGVGAARDSAETIAVTSPTRITPVGRSRLISTLDSRLSKAVHSRHFASGAGLAHNILNKAGSYSSRPVIP